jgi:hypothetical protein
MQLAARRPERWYRRKPIRSSEQTQSAPRAHPEPRDLSSHPLHHALMHPQLVDLDHRRVLFDCAQQHAARLLDSLQFGIRL